MLGPFHFKFFISINSEFFNSVSNYNLLLQKFSAFTPAFALDEDDVEQVDIDLGASREGSRTGKIFIVKFVLEIIFCFVSMNDTTTINVSQS